VHGPLSLIFLLELLRAERKGRVKGLLYRCLAPVVVGEVSLGFLGWGIAKCVANVNGGRSIKFAAN